MGENPFSSKFHLKVPLCVCLLLMSVCVTHTSVKTSQISWFRYQKNMVVVSYKTLYKFLFFFLNLQQTRLEGAISLVGSIFLTGWFSASFQQRAFSCEAQNLSSYMLCFRNVMLEWRWNSKTTSSPLNCWSSFPVYAVKKHGVGGGVAESVESKQISAYSQPLLMSSLSGLICWDLSKNHSSQKESERMGQPKCWRCAWPFLPGLKLSQSLSSVRNLLVSEFLFNSS